MEKRKTGKHTIAGFLQRKNERGDAMIIVLCILMLFMVLSFSVLAAAAAVLGTSKRNAVSERCKTAAASFSTMMEEQLVQERKAVPMKLQTFFMDMVQEKMKLSSPQNADFYWDEDGEDTEIPAELIHEIVVTNGGQEMGQLINGYNISVKAVWVGSREIFQKAYEVNAGKAEAEKLPEECCYSGIKLKVTTICENEKMRERYQTTVYYHVWIQGQPGAEQAELWKFSTDGRETA